MKKLMNILTVFAMLMSLAACSAKNDTNNSSNTSNSSNSDNASDESSTETSGTETEAPAESADDSSEAEESKPDEEISSELDEALSSKITAMLTAADNNDWESYWEAFDYEQFEKASQVQVGEEAYKAEEKEYFTDLAEGLGGDLTGETQIMYQARIVSQDMGETEIYGVSLVAEGQKQDHSVSVVGYKAGEEWSVQMEYISSFDKAYYQFEPLIKEELAAAAAGDKDSYLKTADLEVYKDISAKLAEQQEDTSEMTKEEKDKAADESYDIFETMANDGFDDLSQYVSEESEAAGTLGKIVQVTEFPESENSGDDWGIYGRFVLTLTLPDGEYLEIEGYAYYSGEEKGVIIQPD